jgi:CRISPR-associated protein (TIGR03986 family)
MSKPYRIRVRVTDGAKRDAYKLRGRLAPHIDFVDVGSGLEFVLCAVKEKHLEKIRPRLVGAGLEEIEGSTEVPKKQPSQKAKAPSNSYHHRKGGTGTAAPPGDDIRRKPYGFVPLPDQFTTKPPVWHDGTSSAGRLSGEVHFELECLTPLLVGWQQQKVGDADGAWPIPYRSNPREEDGVVDVTIDGVGRSAKGKSVLCPLRAPWDEHPVLIPGDSLKGLLRHELGALLGAPMERVAERSYSYRPNSMHPHVRGEPAPRLIPRLARVPDNGVELRPLGKKGSEVRVPVRLELLPENLKYDKHKNGNPPHYRFDDGAGTGRYRGGMGAGQKLNLRRSLHKNVLADPVTVTHADVPEEVQEGYLHTLRHLVDLDHGHFSERHPDAPNTVTGKDARDRILQAAGSEVFSPGDMVWVEWDTEKKCIVSLGWHYYYRWAYQDTIRHKGWKDKRPGLFPHEDERTHDEDGEPEALTAVRRLFGYTGDNEGSEGIGEGDHQQLMGRLSVNTAIEVVQPGEPEDDRFLAPTFLKELGMPRPSAVEFYLKQPHHPGARPSDRATLVTYGDAAGYDAPGELAGRKFYLDRSDAYDREPWKDDSEANRLNDRATLALEASKPGRRFRFMLRFRDLDAEELAAVLLALCPNQFAEEVGGKRRDGYCSKLGYARPLGWGSVRIVAKELLLLNDGEHGPELAAVGDCVSWFKEHHTPVPMLDDWLEIHRCKHADAGDYPRKDGEIYSFHTRLRAQHSRWRRHNR